MERGISEEGWEEWSELCLANRMSEDPRGPDNLLACCACARRRRRRTSHQITPVTTIRSGSATATAITACTAAWMKFHFALVNTHAWYYTSCWGALVRLQVLPTSPFSISMRRLLPRESIKEGDSNHAPFETPRLPEGTGVAGAGAGAGAKAWE